MPWLLDHPKLKSSFTIIATSVNTSVPLVSPSEKRRALMISQVGGGAAFASNSNPAVLQQGFQVNGSGQPNQVMTWDTVGDAVRKPWFGIATNAVGFWTIFEVLEL